MSITAQIDPQTGYFTNINDIRQVEYPQLRDITYLDHSGRTPYANSLISTISSDLRSNLFGNPHSGAESSQRSTQRISQTRAKLLNYFNASSDDFDIVFVANATAAIKLVAEAFRDHTQGFDYAYHIDSHNSLVGVRELARTKQCVGSGTEVDDWLRSGSNFFRRTPRPKLLAFPGQSNLTGHRPDLSLCATLRTASTPTSPIYTLLDAAALLSTSALDLSNPSTAPDFTALSLYKIFGYPDLGALIVHKQSAGILLSKRFFAGGTVDAVTTDNWHARHKCIHETLEEGTVPFHNIIALDHALDVHKRLYGGPENVSRHARYLTRCARRKLLCLRHSNGKPVCRLYGSELDDRDEGPVIAFNVLDHRGRIFRTGFVEQRAIRARIHLRKGGMCNPGGISRHLGMSPATIRELHTQGVRCSDDSTAPGSFTGAVGMLRVGFGAMSSIEDVESLVGFITSFVDEDVGYASVTGKEDDGGGCRMESVPSVTKPVEAEAWEHSEKSDGRGKRKGDGNWSSLQLGNIFGCLS